MWRMNKRMLFVFQGIGTAKNASDQLDIHLLNSLNQMLHKLKSDAHACSVQVFHHAIKQAYFELDQNLRKLVKDESGCVCVRSLFFSLSMTMICERSTRFLFRSHVSLVRK